MRLHDALWGVRCVWLRYFDVFRESLRFYVVTTSSEPILYLLSFGLGVGALVGSLKVHEMEVTDIGPRISSAVECPRQSAASSARARFSPSQTYRYPRGPASWPRV